MHVERPILVLAKSRADRAMDVMIVITIILTWTLTIVSYKALPDIIPMHYDLAGKVDRYDSKAGIWFLPVISVLIIMGMRFINKFPHNFNYLVKITPDNARAQYTGATRMIRYFQLIVALLFLFIIYDTIRSAHAGSSLIGAWFIPVLFLVFLIPLVISLFKMRG